MRPQLVRRGRNRWYVDLDKPLGNGKFAKIDGVTTIIGNGWPKPGLINWAGEATAEYAVNNWATLDAMPVADRLKTIKKGRYENRDKAGERGRTIHKCAEDLIAGKTVPIPEGLEGYVNACVRFLNQFDYEPMHTEALVWSETHYYCGQLDALGSVALPDQEEWDYIPRDTDGRSVGLFDFKSGASGIWGDMAYQFSGYRFADFLLTDDGEVIEVPRVDFTAGIHLKADGTYSVVPVQADHDEFAGFLKIKAVAELVDGTRELAMDPITPPYENRYRLVSANDDDPYTNLPTYTPPPVVEAPAVGDAEAIDAEPGDDRPSWATPGGTADIPAEVMADETAAAADPEDMN